MFTNGYTQKLDEVYKIISKCEDGKNIDELLGNGSAILILED